MIRDQDRMQTLIGLGAFAIGVVAFLADEHLVSSWRQLTIHHWVQLGVAGFGLLITPLNMRPVKEKLDVASRVLPWIRRSSTAQRAVPDDDKAVNDR